MNWPAIESRDDGLSHETLAVTIAAMASEIGVDGAMRITPGRTKALSCALHTQQQVKI